MKKIFLTLMLMCAVVFTGFAQSKFYINPGHGGHDSDDRPTALPLGVEMFYESDGSLDRGFSLRDFFNGLGCQTAMSRTTNYSSDDLDLNVIAAYSNSFGGYFISLHTNGFNASTNYVLAFYKGSSSSYPYIYEPAPTMAQKVADWHYVNPMSDITYSIPRGLADYSFYGYHLGVLRTNTRPGYLVESWFHDYRPDGLRMKSTLFNRYLAWQICRSSFDSPGGIPNTLKGCIVGDIRDVSKGCGYSEYTSRNRDSKFAINGATVKLLNANGDEVASCNTDNCCNGVYGFFNVDAGNYTLVVSKSGYKTQRIGVSVSDMASTLRNIDLEEGNSDGIYANVSNIDFGFVYSGNRPQREIKIEGYGLPSNISVSSTDNTNFSLSANSLSANGGTLTVTYNPATIGSHSAVITFSSGSYSVKVNVKGSADETPLKNITDKWNYSDANGNATALGFDTRKINNFCYANGKLYCVYDHSRIIVLNAQTAEVLGDLPMNSTISGGTYLLSDVAYVDGKIVACNMVKAGEEIKIYSWDTDSSAPQILLHTTDLCGAAELGYAMEFGSDSSFSGDLRVGFIYDDGSVSKMIEYDRNSSGTWTSKTAQVTNSSGDARYPLGKYARLYPWSNGTYWVDGCDSRPTYIVSVPNTSNTKYGEYCSVNLDNTWGSCHREFYWNGQKYSANVVFDGKKNGRMAVVQDNTGNYSSITIAGTYPAKGLGSSENTTGAGDIYINTDEKTYFEAWVFTESQGLVYLTYGNVPQNQNVYGPFRLTDKWNYSAAKGNADALGFDAKKINNFCYANGKLYCVYDHSRIIVLNAQTAEVLGDLPMNSTISGGAYLLSDVAYVDGKIVACNMVKAGEEIKIYSWDTDSSAPQILLHTTDLCGAAELGYAMEFNSDASFSGDIRVGFIYDDGSVSKMVEYDRNSSGTWTSKTAQVTNSSGDARYPLGKYARLYPWSNGTYWVDGCDSRPTYIVSVPNTSNSKYGEYCSIYLDNTWGSCQREFYWNGQKYAANVVFDGKKNGRMNVLQDNAGNYTATTPCGSYPEGGLGSAENTTGAGDIYINTDGSNYFEAWVFSENQGFAYLTYGNVPQNQDVYGPFKLKEKWNHSVANGNAFEDGYDATLINNFCYANGKLYCVYNHERIIVLNAQTGALLGSLKMSPVVAGGTYTLSDVSYIDGRIVACNFVKAGDALRIYCWSSDTALPELLLSTMDLQGAQELGLAMEPDRNPSFNGQVWLGFVEDNGSETKIIEYCRNSDGSWTAKHVYVTDANGNYRSIGQPARVYPWGGTYWIDGARSYPTYLSSIDNTNTKYSEACHVTVPSGWGESHHEFTWASQKYAVNIVFDGKKNGRMYLLQDNAGNYSTITPMGAYPETGLGDVENTTGGGDVIINTDGSASFEGWVFAENQGIAYYSYGPVAQNNPQPLTGANPYAYELSSYPEGYNLVATYSLNADAENVDFIFYDKYGNQVHTESLGARTAGQHTDYVDVTALPEDDGYSWAVSVKGASKSSPQEFMSLKFYNPRSVEVDNNSESETFGNVYCTEGMAVPNTGYYSSNNGQGLYAFKPDFSPIINPNTGNYAFMGGLTPSNNANGKFGPDLQKVRVSNDGRIFVTRGNDSGSYIAYAPSFEDLVENNRFESLLRNGSNDASNLMYRDGAGNFLAAANLGFDIKGEGDNLKLLALSYQYSLFTTYNPTYARVDEYSLGNSDALSSPRNIMTGKYTVYPDGTNIAYDNRGGIWYCQYRSEPSESTPSLVYIDANGNERLKETTVVRGGAGIRLSPDCSKIAIASSVTEFTVYNLSYSGDGAPSLSAAYTVSHGMGANVNDIAWDIANNVYVCGNISEYFKAFALPVNTPALTKAKDMYNFTKLSTGVDKIAEDEADGDAVAEYYNLLGIKISADNLRPGIYIRKIGNKTDKILIK